MLDFLSPEKALIFRITHIENLEWTLANGLFARSAPPVSSPTYREIGNADLIEKRKLWPVGASPFGCLSDYVPFYFTPSSPMLLNILTGKGVARVAPHELVILVSSLPAVTQHGRQFVFTDRHARLAAAQFFTDREDLSRLDWGILRARDFRADPEDPGKMERYQAEALVYRELPVTAVEGIACVDHATEETVRGLVVAASSRSRVVVRPTWFFQ